MHGGTKVVKEFRQREFECARAAAGCRLSFKNFYPQSGLREHDGGSKPVWTCTDDDRSLRLYCHLIAYLEPAALGRAFDSLIRKKPAPESFKPL
jgi:hypothetical protein